MDAAAELGRNPVSKHQIQPEFGEMSSLTRDGTAEPVSRDQILRHARGQGNIIFPCSADHEQDWQPYPVDPYSAIIIYVMVIHIQVSLIPPWEDQCEWHRMTRMTGPDCAVMCNLINIHTYIQGQQYDLGEKPIVMLYHFLHDNRHADTPNLLFEVITRYCSRYLYTYTSKLNYFFTVV